MTPAANFSYTSTTDLTRIEDLTRREFISSAFGAALLIACGDDEEDAPTPMAATRLVETLNGEIEVPSRPQRVVTTHYIATFTLLELGYSPVGVARGGLDYLSEHDGRLASLPEVNPTNSEPDIELIASLKPDLILGSDFIDPEQRRLPYDRLSTIAPTVVVEWQAAAANWQTQSESYASAVGLTTEFGELRREFQLRCDAIKATYAAQLDRYTWDLVLGGDGAYFVYSPRSAGGQVLAAAGIRLGAGADLPENFEKVSYEQIFRLAETGVIALDGRESAAANVQALIDQPLFRDLEASRSDRVHKVPWFFPSSYKTAMALLGGVEAVLKQIS